MSQSPISIDSYLRTYDRLQKAIEGLTDAQLVWKPSEKQWSVTEVLTHLTDHNIVVSFRIREVLAGSEVRLPAFNQDFWVEGQRANAGRTSDILAAFQGLLLYNSLLFQRLTEADWNKTGVNFKGHTVTVAAIAQSFIDHVGHHIGQIERIIEAETNSRKTIGES
ncbi:DinB family protein [Cohnella terricola]|uniref:DinB family protein n=1 Tax=Cohnella terricola TaxID=1289167 RepID=A0A559J9A8_9BACL|nr:DinB family protein [Cohnella terricola]TVX96441.1 DinB family protein [Cohnella terricola]